jgi:ATP-dependent exoDNAse (exonuclease V) beta subunit
MSSLKPYLALEASAGSGKTYALSVRYIALLYLGAKPSNILTLTFTNKAASEMKSRICEVLMNLENKNELKDIALLVGVSKDEILAKKQNILKKFLKDDLLISTFDSFFAKVLRKFSLYAGLMPDFGIEDKLVEEKVLKKFLSLCILNKQYESLVKFSVNEEKQVGDIFALLNTFYNKECEFQPESLQSSYKNNEQKILKIADELKNIIINAKASKSAIAIFDVKDVNTLIAKSVFAKLSLSEHKYFKKYFTQEMDDKFFELKDEIARHFNYKESYLLGKLGELFHTYKRAIAQTNKEFSTLSFADVTNVLYNLLKNEINRDFLYFRLDSKCEHILVDEFQDTNVMQYKILEPLFEEVISGIGQEEFKTLFFVGDVKQSIYRFRGGAKELFGYAKKQFNLQKDTLDTNYRSSKNVVEFVNKTFIDKIKGYEKQKVSSTKVGFVEVDFSEDLVELATKKLEVLFENGANPKDIALLTHQNKDAKELKDILSAKFEGITFQNDASIKLIEVPMVKAVIEFLKFAYFGDNLYKSNFLALIGKQIDENLDTSWVDFSQTPMQIIKKVIEKYELFSDDIDLIRLLEVSSSYADIESFLFESERISAEANAQDNSGVKILTIHKSKGLEFPHVIVVDRFGAKNNRGKPLIFEYDGIDLKGIYKRVKNRECFDTSYKRAKEKEQILEYEDTLNLHYVAFSRAKDSLMICSKKENSAFEYLTLTKETFGKIEINEEKEDKKDLHVVSHIPSHYGKQEVKITSENEEDIDFFAIDFGLAMHYCLELMNNFDEQSLQIAYSAMCNRYSKILDENSLKNIYKRVQRLINHKPFLELIEGKKLYKEQPLIFEGERKQIDLLCESEDEITIIDYKSSLHVDDSHLAQVRLYKKALRSISNKRVNAYLIYVRDNEIKIESV